MIAPECKPGDRPEAQCNAAEGSRSHGFFRSPCFSRVDHSTLYRARGVRPAVVVQALVDEGERARQLRGLELEVSAGARAHAARRSVEDGVARDIVDVELVDDSTLHRARVDEVPPPRRR